VGEVFHTELRTVTTAGPRTDADVARILHPLEGAARRGARKPAWLKIALPGGPGYGGVRRILRARELHTVCEEAACPNRQECWSAGTATFLILGATCSRRCRFCAVAQGRPAAPDASEPGRVAAAAQALDLQHVVVTSVTRDDLPDGGSEQFAATIAEIRGRLPGATVEVLVPDFGGCPKALGRVLGARPDVLNHNVETVVRLYPRVRPGALYQRSLDLLRGASRAGIATKSGFMVGLGESRGEITSLLTDLRQVGCERVTIGQYLQPRRELLPVKRYWTRSEFAAWHAQALELGFRDVQAGPLVRSSYRARGAIA
jgi:lipoic acid synthetase